MIFKSATVYNFVLCSNSVSLAWFLASCQSARVFSTRWFSHAPHYPNLTKAHFRVTTIIMINGCRPPTLWVMLLFCQCIIPFSFCPMPQHIPAIVWCDIIIFCGCFAYAIRYYIIFLLKARVNKQLCCVVFQGAAMAGRGYTLQTPSSGDTSPI